MQKWTRTGAYALMVKEGSILLTKIESGPYAQAWHLPGGGIEFAEQPLQALHRELLEEAALNIYEPVLLTVLSHHGEHSSVLYHFVGLVYKVEHFSPAERIPEDEARWFPIQTLDFSQVTPFVQQLRDQKLF